MNTILDLSEDQPEDTRLGCTYRSFASMSNIVAILASDANSILESFRSAFERDSISFLNVDDIPTGELRSQIFEKSRDIDICLIFSSDVLVRRLRPLSRPERSLREEYLLASPETFTIQLNLTR